MLCKEARNYLETAKGLPFFYVVGDDNYCSILDDLKEAGLSEVKISSFCSHDDKFPDLDDLIDHFRISDVDYRDNKFVVTGVGEYLALRGKDFADKTLRRLKTTTLGNARVILLLRGVSEIAEKLIKDDTRLCEQQRAFISGNRFADISITNIAEDICLLPHKGIKFLLAELENGASGSITGSTQLFLDNSLFPVKVLRDAFTVICQKSGDCGLRADYGTNEQWKQFLTEIHKCNNNISTVFEKYAINDEWIIDNLYFAISGKEFKNWLIFLYLHINACNFNDYCKLAISDSSSLDELKNNLLVKIIDIPLADSSFDNMYQQRKRLLKSFPEAEVASFINENEAYPQESVYRLTDNTLLEKQTIVRWISQNGIRDDIAYVYPALTDYLKTYYFDGTGLDQQLTQYFESYKKQKVTNQLSEDFVNIAEKYAEDNLFARLPSRDDAIRAISKKDAFLCWIDALGVEYMSYIEALAREKGLSIHADIARADLPTITSVNKTFYDQWVGEKYKEDQLDNIKHKDQGGYYFTKSEEPIHIPAELAVIQKVMELAASKLTSHDCKTFVIASDHGASRLAVIKKQEVPYEANTKGEHSGRCCKAFEGWNFPHAIEENGFIVLSDYGRFRGGRSANVEVHGGACLEEVVVPVITLTLKKQASTRIRVVDKNNIYADRRDGVNLILYITDVEDANNISLRIDGKKYLGKPEKGHHFVFELKDVKRAKQYEAEVFDSSDFIGKVEFKVNSKSASVNEEFDFGDDF